MTQQEIEKRGFCVERVGVAWRITGCNVSVLVVDLKLLRPRDLLPVVEIHTEDQRDGRSS